MPLTNAASGGQNRASDIQQIVNLLTGSMTDQPVTFKGDNTRAPTLVTLDSVNAAQPVGLQFADAGSAKWLWQKDASNNLVLTGPAAGRLGVGAAPNANVAAHFQPSFTAPAATSGLTDFSGTITAHANTDSLIGASVGAFTGLTFAKGAFTGLLAFGLYVNGGSFAQSGGGTIATAYALRVTAPTIGTNNIGARIDGRVGLGIDPAVNAALHVSQPITASGAAAYGMALDATITAAANSDQLSGLWLGQTVAKGTFTGLTWSALRLVAPSATGAGAILNAYALYADAPTIGTTNYAAAFMGNVGIGTNTPGNPLVVLGATNLYAAVFDSSAPAAGSSYGIRVQGGGNSSDYVARLQDRLGNDKLAVRGDGFINFGAGSMSTAGLLSMTGGFNSNGATADATTYQDYVASTAGATARTLHQTTLSIAAVATAIISQDNQGFRAYLAVIHGTDGTNYFADLVLWTTGTVTTITSVTDAGTPAARTYSTNGNGQLKLAMASGTYRTNAFALALNPR